MAHFVRALRKAGLPVGPGAVLDAVSAVEAARIGARDDLYWTLHAVLVRRREHSGLFSQAFRLFWRRRDLIEKLIAQMSPVAPPAERKPEKPEAGALRVHEALNPRDRPPPPKPEETTISARLSVSDREVLRARDFAQMTAAEVAEAQRLVAALAMPDDARPQRRFVPAARGRLIDPRRTFRHSLRAGGGGIALAFRQRRTRPPPVVALVDISGSMAEYSRVFLHFLHALGTRRRVHSFVFATRLTNVSRELTRRDPDEALSRAGSLAADWEGGTRIAQALHVFNRRWSRRVLGQGAVVLLFTDGLEREVGDDLAFEMDRLKRSCRRLVWLNPLLRYEGFEARAGGIRAMLPHVHDFRPIHSLAAMADLCRALAVNHPAHRDPRAWLRAAG